eukprot:scaffold3603_cov192-Pinguiococcus_pyrenoidosus.AAC.2
MIRYIKTALRYPKNRNTHHTKPLATKIPSLRLAHRVLSATRTSLWFTISGQTSDKCNTPFRHTDNFVVHNLGADKCNVLKISAFPSPLDLQIFAAHTMSGKNNETQSINARYAQKSGGFCSGKLRPLLAWSALVFYSEVQAESFVSVPLDATTFQAAPSELVGGLPSGYSIWAQKADEDLFLACGLDDSEESLCYLVERVGSGNGAQWEARFAHPSRVQTRVCTLSTFSGGLKLGTSKMAPSYGERSMAFVRRPEHVSVRAC